MPTSNTEKTIYSLAQLKIHKVTVDDHAISNGGKQKSTTQKSYIIFLQIHSKLVYIDMCLPTKQKLWPKIDGKLFHIIFTANWN